MAWLDRALTLNFVSNCKSMSLAIIVLFFSFLVGTKLKLDRLHTRQFMWYSLLPMIRDVRAYRVHVRVLQAAPAASTSYTMFSRYGSTRNRVRSCVMLLLLC